MIRVALIFVVIALAAAAPHVYAQSVTSQPASRPAGVPATPAERVEALRARPPASADELALSLLEAGEEAASQMIQSICKDPLRGAARDGSGARRNHLYQLLEKLPASVLDGFSRKFTNPAQRTALQALVLDVLEWSGRTSGDVLIAIQIFGAREPGDLEYPGLATKFETTVAAILRRDMKLMEAVGKMIAKADLNLQFNLLAAVGATRTRAGSRYLCEQLGRAPVLDGLILQNIGRVRGLVPVALSDADLLKIRGYLNSHEPEIRREAALTLGRLEDFEAVPTLIDALDDSHRGARENAYWALRKISKVQFRPDSARWRAWYESEKHWWESAGRARLSQLNSAEEPKVIEAIKDLAGRKLYRNEITEALLPLITNDRSTITTVAYAAIVSLQSNRAIPGLAAKLESGDEASRRRAIEALAAITGESCGEHREDWLRQLE